MRGDLIQAGEGLGKAYKPRSLLVVAFLLGISFVRGLGVLEPCAHSVCCE